MDTDQRRDGYRVEQDGYRVKEGRIQSKRGTDTELSRTDILID